MEELQIDLLEGRTRPQVEYTFRYPKTPGGRSPFDRFWRQTARGLQRQAWREPGRFPTVLASEWQETRRDARFCSGFLDISRKIGHGDWSLWRVSATFSLQSTGPQPLRGLLGNDWQKTLQPIVLQRLEEGKGENTFFRGWQRRACTLLRDGRFYLTDEGLCLWFPQETLGPKNAGLPTVLLPYDSLDILRRLC
ncbi:MAG: DUF3298 domain-containing protein [Clostridia bacterium]|nr:DUF3298 domain-containing protein [Clostridia bacterium]